jgi:hypothetical protein
VQTLKELCEQYAPLPWPRALWLCRELATQKFVGAPALTSDAILIDGDHLHVTTLPEAPVRSGDEHAWIDSAVRLWKNMQDRAEVVVQRDQLFAYVSPEQLMGKPVDEISYVYSIGVVAFELLTKRQPFADAHGYSAVVSAQLRREPSPPSTYASIPSTVDALVLRCLRKHRAERFASLAALALAIDDQLGDRGKRSQ